MATKLDSAGMDWQTALNNHQRLLREHVAFWQRLSSQTTKKSEDGKTARRLQKQTMAMISQCDQLNALSENSNRSQNSTLENSSKRPSGDAEIETVQPALNEKKQRKSGTDHEAELLTVQPKVKYKPPVIDVSGLFSIDTNPTPVDLGQIPAEAPKKKGKRTRQSDGDSEGQIAVSDTNGTSQPAKKKAKTKHEPAAHGHVHDDMDSADEMEHKIAVRLKQKDEKQTQKANKKRKRNNSDPEVNGHTEEDVANTFQPNASGATRKKSAAESKQELTKMKKNNNGKKAKVDAGRDSRELAANGRNADQDTTLAGTKQPAAKPKRKKAK